MLPSPTSGQQFCLRLNRDGTLDSICLKCFLTVSHGKSEADCAQLEKNHVCNPYDVERFQFAKVIAEKSSSRVSRSLP